ncbi:hypothetical protein IAU59_002075 [Kwoniella sp. CBS 9459]
METSTWERSQGRALASGTVKYSVRPPNVYTNVNTPRRNALALDSPSNGGLFRGLGFHVHEDKSNGIAPDEAAEFVRKSIQRNGGSISPIPSLDMVSIIIIPKITTYTIQPRPSPPSSSSYTSRPLGAGTSGDAYGMPAPAPAPAPALVHYAPLSNEFAWGDPAFYDAKQTWTPDLLIRYFEETVRDGQVIQRRKVVVKRDWIGACFRAGRVLGDADDWGGLRIRGTYDLPPLTPMPTPWTSITPHLYPAPRQKHSSSQGPFAAAPSHQPIQWEHPRPNRSQAQNLWVPFDSAPAQERPKGHIWTSYHPYSHTTRRQPVISSDNARQFQPIDTACYPPPYRREAAQYPPESSGCGASGSITHSTPITPITPMNVARYHAIQVPSQATAGQPPHNPPQPWSHNAHFFQNTQSTQSDHGVVRSNYDSTQILTDGTSFGPSNPLTAQRPSKNRHRSEGHPAAIDLSRPCTSSAVAQGAQPRPVFVDGRGSALTFHLPAKYSEFLQRAIESGGGRIRSAHKAQFIILPTTVIESATAVIRRGGGREGLDRWGAQKWLVSEQWIIECLSRGRTIHPGPFLLRDATLGQVHPPIFQMSKTSRSILDNGQHMQTEMQTPSSAGTSQVGGKQLTSQLPDPPDHSSSEPVMIDITVPEACTPPNTLDLSIEPQPLVPSQETRTTPHPPTTPATETPAPVSLLSMSTADEANLTLLRYEFEAKPESQSSFDFLVDMHAKYPDVKWSVLFLSKKFRNMARAATLEIEHTILPAPVAHSAPESPPRVSADQRSSQLKEAATTPRERKTKYRKGETKEQRKKARAKAKGKTVDQMIAGLLDVKKKKKKTKRSHPKKPQFPKESLALCDLWSEEGEDDHPVTTDSSTSAEAVSEDLSFAAESLVNAHRIGATTRAASDDAGRTQNDPLAYPNRRSQLSAAEAESSLSSDDVPSAPPTDAEHNHEPADRSAPADISMEVRPPDSVSHAAGYDEEQTTSLIRLFAGEIRADPAAENEIPGHDAADDQARPISSVEATKPFNSPQAAEHPCHPPNDVNVAPVLKDYPVWIDMTGSTHLCALLGEGPSPTLSAGSMPESPLMHLPSSLPPSPVSKPPNIDLPNNDSYGNLYNNGYEGDVDIDSDADRTLVDLEDTNSGLDKNGTYPFAPGASPTDASSVSNGALGIICGNVQKNQTIIELGLLIPDSSDQDYAEGEGETAASETTTHTHDTSIQEHQEGPSMIRKRKWTYDNDDAQKRALCDMMEGEHNSGHAAVREGSYADMRSSDSGDETEEDIPLRLLERESTTGSNDMSGEKGTSEPKWSLQVR